MTPSFEILEDRILCDVTINDGRFLRQNLGKVGVYVVSPELQDEVDFGIKFMNAYTSGPGVGTRLVQVLNPAKAKIFVKLNPSLSIDVGGKVDFIYKGNGYVLPFAVISVNTFLFPEVNSNGILVHEFGHALGLRHPNPHDPTAIGCIMQAFVQPNIYVSYNMALSLYTLYLRPRFQGEWTDTANGPAFVRFKR